nr:MAG TPA: FN3 [Caudoviricetes sp.]
MAFGQNQHLGWIEAWSNGHYRVSNYVTYKQDLENRKLEITLTNQQCCSLDRLHTFYNYEGVNNGYGWQVMGGQVVDVNDAVNVPAGGCWTHSGDRYAIITVNYNNDGSVPDILMSTQFIAGINQYDTPEFNWTTKNIKTLFPSINAKVQAPTITNVDVISSTSATVEFTSVENATKYHITLKHQDGAVTAYITTDTRYTFNHLSPNQNYTVTVQSEDVYGSRSDASDSYSFSTKINVGQVETELTVTNLKSYTQYTVIVKGMNGDIEGEEAQLSVITDKFDAPTVNTTIGVNQVTVSCSDVGASQYNFSLYDSDKSLLESQTIEGRTYAFSNLESGNYFVQVVGYDGNYGDYSGYYAFSITEEILDPPGNLWVVETTPTSATLSWDAVADATGYALYLYDESTTTQIKKISPITRLDYTITGLTPETRYSARLSSINSDGKEGEKTDIISFETSRLKNVKVLVNVNGVAKEGTMYTNVAGDSKKVIDIYFNVLGEAKEAV